MAKVKTLPVPDFFDSKHCRDFDYAPDYSSLLAAAGEWKRRFGLKPVAADTQKIFVLSIDNEKDFFFPPPRGRLYVAGRTGTGAMDAGLNLVTFEYRYLQLLSGLFQTMDTHLVYQIFFPAAHIVTATGKHPEPNTVISADDYRRGVYKPSPAMISQLGVSEAWLTRQFTFYCEQLEKSGKKKLYIWPYHCVLGSDGHPLAGVIEEVRFFHSVARGADNIPEIKGGNPLTEHYSIFAPEVMLTFDGRPIPGAQKNTKLIERLLKGKVLIAGLASSHCVKESIRDLLLNIQTMDPKLVKNVYILRDCIAPVVIPNVVDYTDEAEAALQEFQDAGMNVVVSTEPIESWPGMQF